MLDLFVAVLSFRFNHILLLFSLSDCGGLQILQIINKQMWDHTSVGGTLNGNLNHLSGCPN